MKHLIPEFDALRARYPAGFESSLVLPCLRRIQEDRGYVADSDIDALVAYLGVPRIQIEEVLSLLHAVPAQADRPLAPAGLPQRVVLAARRRSAIIEHLDEAARHRAGPNDGRRPLHAVDGRVPGSCGTRAGGDGQRDLPREHERRNSSTRCSRRLPSDDGHQAAHDLPGHARPRTRSPTTARAAATRRSRRRCAR